MPDLNDQATPLRRAIIPEWETYTECTISSTVDVKAATTVGTNAKASEAEMEFTMKFKRTNKITSPQHLIYSMSRVIGKSQNCRHTCGRKIKARTTKETGTCSITDTKLLKPEGADGMLAGTEGQGEADSKMESSLEPQLECEVAAPLVRLLPQL